MELGRVAVVAIGSSVLPATAEAEDDALRHVGSGVCELVTRGWHVVVTHSSAPYLAMARRRDALAVAADPTLVPDGGDVIAAEAQGALGYRVMAALDEALARRHRHERACVVLTRVLVSLDDPAFARAAARIEAEGSAPVVASPKPLRVLDVDPIADLLDRGHVVIAGGGGGIPVARDAAGAHHGVVAAVDKDYTSARLALDLDADLFVLCTDVPHLAVEYRTPAQRDLHQIDDVEAEQLLRTHQLAPGTMAPKIEAALWFLRSPSRHARSVLITTPELMTDALIGRAGTRVFASERSAP
jgi:carbamate kinase